LPNGGRWDVVPVSFLKIKQVMGWEKTMETNPEKILFKNQPELNCKRN